MLKFCMKIYRLDVETDGQITVALDTALTDNLIDEGLARELWIVCKFAERFVLQWPTDSNCTRFIGSTGKSISRMDQYVQQETLAVELKSISNADALKRGAKNEDINGEPSAIAVEKN